jgi:AraC-like DNA-binding protein
MRTSQHITPVRFAPPQADRRDVEALTVAELCGRAPDAHFRRLQRADFFRLIAVTDGETTPMVDFADHPARAMDWLLVRPGQVFRYDFTRPWSGWLLVFRPEALKGASGGASVGDLDLLSRVNAMPSLVRLERDRHAELVRSLRPIRADGVELPESAARNELLRLQLGVVLWRLILWQPGAGPTPPVAARVAERHARFQRLLEARFTTDHQVRQYARALGMGEKTLGRACRAVTGLPAKTLIDQRVALEARRLLAHTPKTVQRIALELCFVDAAHFAKFFRRESGRSAQGFRRSLRESGDETG